MTQTTEIQLDLPSDSIEYLTLVAAENNMTLEQLMIQIIQDNFKESIEIDKLIAEQEAAQDNYEMNIEKQVEELSS